MVLASDRNHARVGLLEIGEGIAFPAKGLCAHQLQLYFKSAVTGFGP